MTERGRALVCVPWLAAEEAAAEPAMRVYGQHSLLTDVAIADITDFRQGVRRLV